jgi:hypothetical protein
VADKEMVGATVTVGIEYDDDVDSREFSRSWVLVALAYNPSYLGG